MMPVATASVVASLVTTTLLSYAAAIALAGVQFFIERRSPQRGTALLRYASIQAQCWPCLVWSTAIVRSERLASSWSS